METVMSAAIDLLRDPAKARAYCLQRVADYNALREQMVFKPIGSNVLCCVMYEDVVILLRLHPSRPTDGLVSCRNGPNSAPQAGPRLRARCQPPRRCQAGQGPAPPAGPSRAARGAGLRRPRRPEQRQGALNYCHRPACGHLVRELDVVYNAWGQIPASYREVDR
jgi:hypothetical protein